MFWSDVKIKDSLERVRIAKVKFEQRATKIK